MPPDPMQPIFFEASMVARGDAGAVVVALFDAPITNGAAIGCVAILSCSAEAALALAEGLGSAAKDPHT